MKLLSNIHLILFQIFAAIFVSLFFTSNVFAEENSLWNDADKSKKVTKQFHAKNTTASLKVRPLEFDEITFKSFINQVGTSHLAAKKSTDQTINLPLPDGTSIEVKITPNSVMTETLAAQFPQITTWDVTGVSDGITGVIDFSDRGLHGMLIMPDGDRVFIEPDNQNTIAGQNELSGQSPYISFSKKENEDDFKTEFSCGAHDNHSDLSFATRGNIQARPSSDLITYRLAVATTGEYSQFHGGTVESTLSAIVTTINRVNQIYRRDLSIQFQLVDEQADLIYLNPNTDPYDNSNVFALIQQNNANLSSSGVLSKTRYDVGHVFGQGGVGGLAVVGGVCDNDEKAFGATGISSPVGDVFDLDFVAHELGHQLGASHTFNSVCQGNERSPVTAVEPGSGTTIMAYPGICPGNNIQNNVDSQFHVVSIDQIRSVTRTGGGSSCGVRNSTINENPTVNAGLDTNVPARTPLVFVADGADTDNDALTYSWEQSDTGAISNVNVDLGDNAIFRSRPLTSDNIRFIPSLTDLFARTVSAGELPPETNREVNMVATVRDGNGGLQADLVKLQVTDTGQSFAVTSHTNTQSFGREESTEVRWNVAGTNSSPISCSNVDIGLVTVDGQGLDIITTPNDGRETITIPSDAPVFNNARFIVSCNTSNFFNVSSGRITILDQVGGGSSSNSGGGGGGSFNLLMLLWGLLLISFRKVYVQLSNKLNSHKNLMKLALIGLPILFSVQACSSPVVTDNSNSDSAMPKEFGSRFSSEKIKKEREAYYAQKLSELKTMSPAAEVKKALQSNDIYYLAVAASRGSSPSIPGLVEPQAQIVNCKTKSVEGMGDVLYGKNHIRYRQEMLRYMREFNTLMQTYCK